MIRRFAVTAALASAAVLTIAGGGSQLALVDVTTALPTLSYPAAPPPAPKPVPKPTAKARSKTCSKGYVTGVIGGVSKCLHQGQRCQQLHAGDYTRYGFSCTQVGGRYTLKSRSNTRPSTTTHPTTPPAKKPVPAAPHRY